MILFFSIFSNALAHSLISSLRSLLLFCFVQNKILFTILLIGILHRQMRIRAIFQYCTCISYRMFFPSSYLYFDKFQFLFQTIEIKQLIAVEIGKKLGVHGRERERKKERDRQWRTQISETTNENRNYLNKQVMNL